MKYISFAIARAALTALILGASAQATILNEYTDFATWSAATGVATPQQTFSSLGSPYVTSSLGITAGSINYRGFYNESSVVGYDTYLNGSPLAGDSIGSGSYMMGGSNGAIGTGTVDAGLRVDLSALAGLNALSFNFSAWRELTSTGARIYSGGTPINLTLQVYESGSLTSIKSLLVPSGSPVSGFFGFTTTGTISSIRLMIDTPTNTNVNRVLLDNLAYATITAPSGGGGGGEIPEPQTYLLCAAGLFGASLLRYKKN
jgi:hypothetical protein